MSADICAFAIGMETAVCRTEGEDEGLLRTIEGDFGIPGGHLILAMALAAREGLVVDTFAVYIDVVVVAFRVSDNTVRYTVMID